MNTKQEVLENLHMADEYMKQLFPHIHELELIVTGGSSFLLKGFKNKFTLDIDSISDIHPEVLEYLESFAINNSAIEVTRLPEGYRDRLVSFTSKCSVLNIKLLSNEDLILSKIGRSSSDDLSDIIRTGILDETNFNQLGVLAQSLIKQDPSFETKWIYFQQNILGEMVA